VNLNSNITKYYSSLHNLQGAIYATDTATTTIYPYCANVRDIVPVIHTSHNSIVQKQKARKGS